MEAIQATSNPWETEKGGDEKEGGEQFVEVEMTPMGEEGGEEEEMKSGESLLPVMAGGLAGNVLEVFFSSFLFFSLLFFSFLFFSFLFFSFLFSLLSFVSLVV